MGEGRSEGDGHTQALRQPAEVTIKHTTTHPILSRVRDRWA